MEMQNRVEKGLFLKQTRESKGIPLRTVHEATKIPMDALRAIEEGYTIRTLTPFYYRGFMKIYAQYLNVELEKFLEDYHPDENLKSVQKITKEDRLYEPDKFNWNWLKPETISFLFKGLAVFLVVFFLVKGVSGIVRKFKNRKRAPAQVSAVQSDQPQTSASTEVVSTSEESSTVPASQIRSPEDVAVVTPPVTTQPVAPKKNVNVSVRAKKDSWLRVQVDGTVVFQSTLRRGTVEQWRANEKIEISGKNIYELEFDLNGKVTESLGRKNRKAKKIIMTENGFTVQ